jgi:multiple sugar transport system substrate-binding protein
MNVVTSPSASMTRRTLFHVLISVPLCLALTLQGCTKQSQHADERVTLVFKHGKIAGDPEAFGKLLEQFERQNPDVRIKDEPLPATTDQQHQFYVINLEGKSSDFDVFSMDVIWVPELARAGWLKDLTHILPPEKRQLFFTGPMDAVTYDDRRLLSARELEGTRAPGFCHHRGRTGHVRIHLAGKAIRGPHL